MSTLMSRDLNIERSSTRLHAPPGGKSSMAGIFGGPETAAPVKAAPAPSASPFATEAAAPVTTTPAPVVEAAPATVFSAVAGTSSNRSVPLSALISQQAGENAEPAVPNTGRRNVQAASSMGSILSQEPEQQTVRRVRQAPGGTSSIVIG